MSLRLQTQLQITNVTIPNGIATQVRKMTCCPINAQTCNSVLNEIRAAKLPRIKGASAGEFNSSSGQITLPIANNTANNVVTINKCDKLNRKPSTKISAPDANGANRPKTRLIKNRVNRVGSIVASGNNTSNKSNLEFEGHDKIKPFSKDKNTVRQ